MNKNKGFTKAEYDSLKSATEGCAARLSDEIKAHNREVERNLVAVRSAWNAKGCKLTIKELEAVTTFPSILESAENERVIARQ